MKKRRINAIPGEIWRPLTGWGAPYEVSDRGRVRRPSFEVERRRGGTQHYGAFLLATHRRGRSPAVQLLVAGGRHRAIRVARLVAEAFLPPPPPGAVLCFRNGDRADVRAENLVWTVPAH